MKKIYLDLKTSMIKPDPVKYCDVYKSEGCSHVDGYLCNYPDCEILGKYIDKVVDKMVDDGFFD